MKKVLASLFALTLSFASKADFILEADAAEYQVGDVINLNISFQNDVPLEDNLDMWFDFYSFFTFDDTLASFDSLNLSVDYANADPFALVTYDAFFDDWSYTLSTFGSQAPFVSGQSLLDLGTLSFIAVDIGSLNFEFSFLGLSDFISFNETDVALSTSVNIVARTVSEPSALALFTLMLCGLFARTKRR